ncbi:hypothetical protein HMPREF1608_01778 [Escherichia coli 908525]|nr:hypothetical protein HMPREF9530_03091 [Escherichia coli MS 21-1]ESD06547.1 hypothetical protein HMPREF1595_02950 [Escherichia coli 907672]ESD75283.1 hypothetical protein HMPREF1608_01778 [Escherichia coli 908525]
MQKLLLHTKKQGKEFQIIGINLTIKELTTFYYPSRKTMASKKSSIKQE